MIKVFFMTFLYDIQTALKWPGYWNHPGNLGAKFKCQCSGNGMFMPWNRQLQNMEISQLRDLKPCVERKIPHWPRHRNVTDVWQSRDALVKSVNLIIVEFDSIMR